MQNCKWHDPTCKCQPFLDQPKVCPMVQSSRINIPITMVCPILSATVQSFNHNIWCIQQKLNLMMMRRRSFFFFCSKNPDLYEVWLIFFKKNDRSYYHIIVYSLWLSDSLCSISIVFTWTVIEKTKDFCKIPNLNFCNKI